MSQVRLKQNEENMLRIQYAARYCFNRAEALNDVVWGLCIFSVVTGLIPNTVPEAWQLGIPVVIDLAALLCGWRLSATLSLAASFRKYFDAYVLGIEIDAFDRDTIQMLFEKALKLERTHLEEARIQMTHTGRDNPPGVKDWYELPKNISPEDELYECQRQNCWWNDRLAKTRLLHSVIIFCAVFGILIGVHSLLKLSLLKTLLCCGPIALRLLERVAINIMYILKSYKIDGIVENLSESRTPENVLKLQSLIDERRGMPVLERNRLHRRRAKRYSEEMQKINENSRR